MVDRVRGALAGGSRIAKAIVAVAILSISIVAPPALAAHKDYVELVSPTFRNGGHETIRIETSPDFPRYDSTEWHSVPGVFPVAREAELGTAAVAYQSGSSLVFEVMLFHGSAYLNAIVYYDDGRVPTLFVKQGQGAIFKEEPISGRWVPERLFPGFDGKSSL